MQRFLQIARSSLRSAVLSASFIGLLFVVHIGRLTAESPRYPISTERVVQALAAYGLNVTPKEIRVPAALTAAIPSPQLELVSMRSASPELVQIELRCHTSGKCLPFFALIEVPPGTGPSFIADAEKRKAPEARAGSAWTVARAEADRMEAPDQIRAGSQITLLLEDAQMRIRIPAVALDSGAPGRDVRVCTPDHRNTFHARVVSSSFARGGLE